MNRSIDQNVLRKIQKALSLANNNSSVHESQTAMLLAQKLMLQHGVSASDLKMEHEVIKEVTHRNATDFGRTPWWKRQLGVIIAENFRCSMYISKIQKANRVMFLGLKEEVEIALEVYEYAKRAIEYHARIYCQSIKSRIKTRTIHNRYRNKFIMGYLAGLYDKFQEQVVQNNWGLLLIKDALVIAEKEKMGLVAKKEKIPSLSRSKEAFLQGYIKGKKFEYPRELLQQ